MPRIVVVSGAASGIGQAVFDALQSTGCVVIGVDQCEPRKSIEPSGRWLVGDVANRDTWTRVATQIEEEGPDLLDGLVQCAAVQELGLVNDFDVLTWDRCLSVNVTSLVVAIQELNTWLKEGSSIVSIGSVHSLATGPGFSLYAASKGALGALTRALAVEFAPRGVRVNSVLPGAVDTPMLRSGIGGEQGLVECARRQILGRVGQPEEIAHTVLFLLDPIKAAFVTGTELVVDGGGMALLSTLRGTTNMGEGR